MNKELVEKAKKLEPVMRIGKNGLTQGVIEEVKKQLMKKKLIKIKFLRHAIEGTDKKKIGEIVAEKTGAELIHQVGFVVVLYKR